MSVTQANNSFYTGRDFYKVRTKSEFNTNRKYRDVSIYNKFLNL